jgi:hypothetical protein
LSFGLHASNAFGVAALSDSVDLGTSRLFRHSREVVWGCCFGVLGAAPGVGNWILRWGSHLEFDVRKNLSIDFTEFR